MTCTLCTSILIFKSEPLTNLNCSGQGYKVYHTIYHKEHSGKVVYHTLKPTVYSVVVRTIYHKIKSIEYRSHHYKFLQPDFSGTLASDLLSMVPLTVYWSPSLALQKAGSLGLTETVCKHTASFMACWIGLPVQWWYRLELGGLLGTEIQLLIEPAETLW